MKSLWSQFLRDEAGFIVSAELVLISTIAVISMVVGLAEVSNSVNGELKDLSRAVTSLNQNYDYTTGNQRGRNRGDHTSRDDQYDNDQATNDSSGGEALVQSL